MILFSELLFVSRYGALSFPVARLVLGVVVVVHWVAYL